jgi:hypothetical protein
MLAILTQAEMPVEATMGMGSPPPSRSTASCGPRASFGHGTLNSVAFAIVGIGPTRSALGITTTEAPVTDVPSNAKWVAARYTPSASTPSVGKSAHELFVESFAIVKPVQPSVGSELWDTAKR